MAINNIYVGDEANDGKGDNLRASFLKVNESFETVSTDLSEHAERLTSIEVGRNSITRIFDSLEEGSSNTFVNHFFNVLNERGDLDLYIKNEDGTNGFLGSYPNLEKVNDALNSLSQGISSVEDIQSNVSSIEVTVNQNAQTVVDNLGLVIAARDEAFSARDSASNSFAESSAVLDMAETLFSEFELKYQDSQATYDAIETIEQNISQNAILVSNNLDEVIATKNEIDIIYTEIENFSNEIDSNAETINQNFAQFQTEKSDFDQKYTIFLEDKNTISQNISLTQGFVNDAANSASEANSYSLAAQEAAANAEETSETLLNSISSVQTEVDQIEAYKTQTLEYLDSTLAAKEEIDSLYAEFNESLGSIETYRNEAVNAATLATNSAATSQSLVDNIQDVLNDVNLAVSGIDENVSWSEELLTKTQMVFQQTQDIRTGINQSLQTSNFNANRAIEAASEAEIILNNMNNVYSEINLLSVRSEEIRNEVISLKESVDSSVLDAELYSSNSLEYSQNAKESETLANEYKNVSQTILNSVRTASKSAFNTHVVNGNGTRGPYILPFTPSSIDNITVYVDGINMVPSKYTISGNELRFNFSVNSNQVIKVDSIVVLSTQEVSETNRTKLETFEIDGANTNGPYQLPEIVTEKEKIAVYIDGILQYSNSFDLNEDGQLTFNEVVKDYNRIKVNMYVPIEFQTANAIRTLEGNTVQDHINQTNSITERFVEQEEKYDLLPESEIVDSDTNITAGSEWNGPHLRLGSYHIWVDSFGRLRYKDGKPNSDTDGSALQTQ